MSMRDLGSARAGLYAWLAQRISALYIAGFSLFVTLRLLMYPIDGYDAWRAWLSGAAVRLALAVCSWRSSCSAGRCRRPFPTIRSRHR